MLAPSRYTSPPTSCTIRAICSIRGSNRPSVLGLVIMNTPVCSSSLAARSATSTNPCGVLLTVTTRKPAMVALAGLVPWAESGINTTERLLSEVAKIGRRHQERGQFAMGPGRRLKRNGRQPRNLGQHVLREVQQGQHALHGRFRLVGVQVEQARQRRQPLVPLGVVLHRTRAQGIEVGVDRHVLRRQIDEVPHHVGLGKLRQQQRIGGDRRSRQQFFNGLLRYVALRQPHGATARPG